MDGARFDDLLRVLLAGGSRRVFLRLSALPLAGGLAASLAVDKASEAKKKRKKCKSKKKVCAGKCGRITYKCRGRKKRVNCGGDVCQTGCPFDSVQEAIAAAEANDSITICAGAFIGNLTVNKNLTLIGAGADATILQGDGTASVVDIAPTATVEMRDFTITGGNSADVGGGISNDNATTTLVNVTVTGNHATQRGGGIDVNVDGNLTLTNCIVSDNEADSHGGGIYSNGTLTLDGSSVTGNESGGNGGGIARGSGTATLTATVISANTAVGDGGGIFNVGALTLDAASSITDNTATAGGGIANEGDVTCAAPTVSGNASGNCVNVGAGTGCDTCSP